MGLGTLKVLLLSCWPPWSASLPVCLPPGPESSQMVWGGASPSASGEGGILLDVVVGVPVGPFCLQVARKLVILEGELERAEERAEVSEL